MKLNEQIGTLRHQKGMTQEELAGKLGVTGQEVSKWESGQCCPDVALLPTLADIFGVTLDTLMGREEQSGFADVYAHTKAYLSSVPENELHRDVFRLSILLHESLCTRGYRRTVPFSLEHGMEVRPPKWGYSVEADPEGCAVYAGCGILLTYHPAWIMPEAGKLWQMQRQLQALSEGSNMAVLYALFALTYQDEDRYVTSQTIADEVHLSIETIEEALSRLDVTVLKQEGKLVYRLSGNSVYLPVLLEMLGLG